MTQENDRNKIDDPTHNLIRMKARQLTGKAGFAWQDLPDLEQELTLGLLKRMPGFDAEKRPIAAFATVVLRSVAANLQRDQRAKKRNPGTTRSLQELVPAEKDHGGNELSQVIGQREQDARLGRSARSNGDRAQLALDIAAVLPRLPDDLRKLAEQLKESTVAAAARTLGIPRTTLNESVRRLRKCFEDAGLRDWL